MKAVLLVASALVVPSLLIAQAAPPAPAAHAVVATPGSVTWGPAPAVLPAGAKLGVLEGDPTKPGEFTMRLWMPNGYTLPPHFHPATEHVTVIQGAFLVGMGDQLDASKFSELPSGSFGAIPAGMRHFARAKGEVIIQLHGAGPWGLTYVNPADDPRNRATP